MGRRVQGGKEGSGWEGGCRVGRRGQGVEVWRLAPKPTQQLGGKEGVEVWYRLAPKRAHCPWCPCCILPNYHPRCLPAPLTACQPFPLLAFAMQACSTA